MNRIRLLPSTPMSSTEYTNIRDLVEVPSRSEFGLHRASHPLQGTVNGGAVSK